MPTKSLMEIATAVCVKNIKSLETIGDYLPYESVRHILIKLESAHQLRQIELNSPQIQGLTGEIWLRIIERDFPLEYKAKGYKPQNQSKWYRVWEKYKRDHDRSLQESEEKLRNALAGLRQDKEKNISKIVERGTLPRMPKKRRRVPKDNTTSVLTFGGGSRTKTVNGASVLRKVRREVKEIANIRGSLSQAIRPPNMRGPQQQTRVSKAPPSMVDEKRIASQPAYRSQPRETSPIAASALEEFQERAAYITDSDSDSDSEDEERDERPAAPPVHKRSPPPVSSAPKPAPRKTGSLMQRKFGAPASGIVKPQTRAIRTVPATPSSASPTKTVSSNAVKPSASKSESSSKAGSSSPTKPTPSSPAKLDKPATQYLPRTQTSPPPGEGSPPPPVASSSSAPAAPKPLRKRKAVDIFMRPKKR